MGSVEGEELREREYGKMDNESGYFLVTGNPFVDAGIYAIEAFYKKDFSLLTPEDLKKKLDFLVDLYLTEGWKKNLYSIFTGNSKFTNPSIKDKKKSSMEYLMGLLHEFSLPKKCGNCIACGKRDATPSKKRDEIPLTGSGKLINFFAGASRGERYCPVCTFSVQFLPLILYSLGGYMMLMHSVSSKIMRLFAKRGYENILRQVLTRDYKGCINEGYTNSENAMFHIIEEITREREEVYSEENPSITAYIFSNYGQNPPPMRIIYLPNNVFRFLVYVNRIDFLKWKNIVNKGLKKIKSEEDIKKKRNEVYLKLLNGDSIVGYFLEKDRSICGNWEILSYYLKEVRNMNEKRIEILKRIGDKIADYIRKTDNTKRLFALETVKSYEALRNIFLKITKDMITSGMEGPLFSTDEYLNDLFPEGALNWKETRDILLFRIYENLADYLREKKGLIKETDLKEEE